jgi:hypothetical protein
MALTGAGGRPGHIIFAEASMRVGAPEAAVEGRYVVHYAATNGPATYAGTQAVWALSDAEAEAERNTRALLEPYCANPLTGDLWLTVGVIARHEQARAVRRGPGRAPSRQ